MRLLIALFVFCLAPEAIAQAPVASGNIAGVVTDAESGEALPGANVVVVGTTYGAATNIDGEFRIIGIPTGEYTLVVSFVSFEPFSTESVTVAEGMTTEMRAALQTYMNDYLCCYCDYGPPIITKAPYAYRVIGGYELERMPLLR